MLFFALTCCQDCKKVQSNELTDRHPTPQQQLFFPRKRERKKKKKKICLSKSQESGGCQGFLSEYYPTKGRCGDCDKNPKGLTLKDGKRNGYLCIFIFFWDKLCNLSFLLFISIHNCPKGIKTTTAKYLGVGGRGLAWEKQV